jgi:hypothetical protein
MANIGENLTVHHPSLWLEGMKGKGKISEFTLTLSLDRRGNVS